MADIHKKGADHKPQLSRLNKIEGQVGGIKKMIVDGRYCVDILTQIKATKSALKSLELVILNNHMNHCLTQAIESKSSKDIQEKVDEIIMLLKRQS